MNRYILNNTGPTEFYRNGPHIHDKIEFLEWVNSHFTVVYTPNPTPFPRNHKKGSGLFGSRMALSSC